MKKILIISPYFYPYTGVGALRMTSLAKYLAENDFQVTVLKWNHYRDQTYQPDEPLAYPFIQILEYPPSLMRGKALAEELFRLHQLNCYHLLLLTCGPFDTIRPTMDFIKQSKIPFLVDFRDLWIYDPCPHKTLRFKLGRIRHFIKNTMVEKHLLSLCSKYIVVTPGNLSIMWKHYPKYKKKGICIYNGYDESALIRSTGQERNKAEFSICILGKFAYYSKENALKLLCAVKKLIEDGYQIKIHHIGTYEDAIHDLLKQSGLSRDAIIEYGQLPYQEALSIAEKCNVMSVIVSYANGLGTKVFDYIALNRPIICIAPPNSEIEALLAPAENAFPCQTSEEIYLAVQKTMEDKIDFLTEDASFAQQFSRKKQNEQYAALMTQIIREQE